MKRMSAVSKVLMVVAAALLVIGVASILAQPGPGGGRRGGRGPGGMMGVMIYLERAWSAVNFELEATDEQIADLKPIFQAAWETRKQALEQAQAERNPQVAMTALQQVQSDIDAALTDTLTEEQLAEWEAYKEAAQAGMGMGFGRRGGQDAPGGNQ